MRVFENTCTFDYSWANVSIANWRKYCAWNTQSTHVIAVDTLNRSVDPSTGIVSLPRRYQPPLPHCTLLVVIAILIPRLRRRRRINTKA